MDLVILGAALAVVGGLLARTIDARFAARADGAAHPRIQIDEVDARVFDVTCPAQLDDDARRAWRAGWRHGHDEAMANRAVYEAGIKAYGGQARAPALGR